MFSCCCMNSVCSVCPEAQSRFVSGSGTAAGGEAAQLVSGTREEEEPKLELEVPHAETTRAEMDIAVLRERYKCTKEEQMRQTRVVMLRRVSEDLSEAVRVVPVTQGLSLLWEAKNGSHDLNLLPFDPTLMTVDSWHVHLDLHRRACHGEASDVATTPCPPVTSSNIVASSVSSCSRRFSSASEPGSSQQEERDRRHFANFTTGSDGSSKDASPASSPNSSQESCSSSSFWSSPKAHHIDHIDIPQGDHLVGSLNSSTGYSVDSSAISPKEDSIAGSLTSFDESSTPDLNEDVAKDKPLDGETGGCRPGWSDLGKFSAPAPNLSRQWSLLGQQLLPVLPAVSNNLNYYPFPRRKSLRKSEAARRLGLYSSF